MTEKSKEECTPHSTKPKKVPMHGSEFINACLDEAEKELQLTLSSSPTTHHMRAAIVALRDAVKELAKCATATARNTRRRS